MGNGGGVDGAGVGLEDGGGRERGGGGGRSGKSAESEGMIDNRRSSLCCVERPLPERLGIVSVAVCICTV